MHKQPSQATHPGREVKRSPQTIRFDIDDIAPEAELPAAWHKMGFPQETDFMASCLLQAR